MAALEVPVRSPEGSPRALRVVPDVVDAVEAPVAVEEPVADVELMADLVARRVDALDALYRRHGRSCYRIARRVVVDVALAEDCVQEAFLGLWRNPERFDARQGSLSSWLVAVTHHKAVDMVRRETAQQRRADAAGRNPWQPAATGDPEDSAWQAVRRQAVRTALGSLPGPQREVLALAYFGGYTQREIAEMVGAPLGTVKTRTFAAMRTLRTVLGPLTEETS